MASAPPLTTAGSTDWTAVDRFGPIPLTRVLFDPKPGTTTLDDVIDLSLESYFS